MVLSMDQLRRAWGPACRGPFTRVALYGKGVVQVKSSIVPAVQALSAQLRAYNYATRAADTGAYNCRRITGGSGYSLHAYGIAIDINWNSNPYGSRLKTNMPRPMIEAIKAIRTNNGQQVWRWGGDYTGNKDAMHFEIVCRPADLATGIKSSGGGGTNPTPAPKPKPEQEDDEDMKVLVTCQASRKNEMPKEIADRWWFVDAATRAWCPTAPNAALAVQLGICKNASPIEVSPAWILEKRPLHPIDDGVPGSAGGTGSNAGHFPLSK